MKNLFFNLDELADYVDYATKIHYYLLPGVW